MEAYMTSKTIYISPDDNRFETIRDFSGVSIAAAKFNSVGKVKHMGRCQVRS